jgi:hypothetical protein
VIAAVDEAGWHQHGVMQRNASNKYGVDSFVRKDTVCDLGAGR